MIFFVVAAVGIVCLPLNAPEPLRDSFYRGGAHRVSVSDLRNGTYYTEFQEDDGISDQSATNGSCNEKPDQGEKKNSVLCYGGHYSRVFDEPFSDSFVLSVEEKLSGCSYYNGVPDYKGFAFRDRMQPMEKPLSDEEVAFVFYEIVASCTPAVPIKGRLAEISFENTGENLLICAVISLDFRKISEVYSITFLPPSATFVLSVPFRIENAEISVISEKIQLSSENFSIPKALLIFGCNAAFGKKDYQTLFGEALENVFVNAGICGESIARAR